MTEYHPVYDYLGWAPSLEEKKQAVELWESALRGDHEALSNLLSDVYAAGYDAGYG